MEETLVQDGSQSHQEDGELVVKMVDCYLTWASADEILLIGYYVLIFLFYGLCCFFCRGIDKVCDKHLHIIMAPLRLLLSIRFFLF